MAEGGDPTPVGDQAGAAATALVALTERYWQFLRHEFPFNALTAGQPLDEPTLFREAPADFARRAQERR